MSHLGDCYEAAARLVSDIGPSEPGPEGADLVLCHGFITPMFGPLAGETFGHAWTEYEDKALDPSNGTMTATTIENYYELAGIDGPDVRYTKTETMTNLAKFGHWGPW